MKSAENAPIWKCVAAIVKEWAECYQRTNPNAYTRRRYQTLMERYAGYIRYGKASEVGMFEGVRVGGETEQNERDKAFMTYFESVEKRMEEVEKWVKTDDFNKIWLLCVKTTDLEYGGRSLYPAFKVAANATTKQAKQVELNNLLNLLPDYTLFEYEDYADIRKVFASIAEARMGFMEESIAVSKAYYANRERAITELSTKDAKKFEKYEMRETAPRTADADELLAALGE